MVEAAVEAAKAVVEAAVKAAKAAKVAVRSLIQTEMERLTGKIPT